MLTSGRYLHSPLHGDTPLFCRQTLASEATTEFVNTNFVLWAADITSRSGYEAAGALRVTSYPYMCVMYAIGACTLVLMWLHLWLVTQARSCACSTRSSVL